jgi:hypothetical protein
MGLLEDAFKGWTDACIRARYVLTCQAHHPPEHWKPDFMPR